jgi:hypothetical protein
MASLSDAGVNNSAPLWPTVTKLEASELAKMSCWCCSFGFRCYEVTNVPHVV